MTRLLDLTPEGISHTSFVSKGKIKDIIKLLTESIQKLTFTIKSNYINENETILKVTGRSTQTTLITFEIYFYEIQNQSLYTVDFKRRQGSILEFNKIYLKICDDLAAIIVPFEVSPRSKPPEKKLVKHPSITSSSKTAKMLGLKQFSSALSLTSSHDK